MNLGKPTRGTELLTREQVFPYSFLDSLEKLSYEGLPHIEEFGSRLGEGEVFEKDNVKGIEVKPISQEDCEHAQNVYKIFRSRNFGDYVKLYCRSDVELLCIIFEKFIDCSQKEYGIDPSQCYTSAGFFWEDMLKSTGVKL